MLPWNQEEAHVVHCVEAGTKPSSLGALGFLFGRNWGFLQQQHSTFVGLAPSICKKCFSNVLPLKKEKSPTFPQLRFPPNMSNLVFLRRVASKRESPEFQSCFQAMGNHVLPSGCLKDESFANSLLWGCQISPDSSREERCPAVWNVRGMMSTFFRSRAWIGQFGLFRRGGKDSTRNFSFFELSEQCSTFFLVY